MKPISQWINSPYYYIEKYLHKKLTGWYKKLTLKEKYSLKDHYGSQEKD